MNDVESFAKWIEEVAGDEPIIAAVIGKFCSYRKDPLDKGVLVDEVLTWEVARPFLDYAFYSGFGGAGCHAVEVYTATKVIFTGDYDGSTFLSWVPRNPMAGKPSYGGRQE